MTVKAKIAFRKLVKVGYIFEGVCAIIEYRHKFPYIRNILHLFSDIYVRLLMWLIK